jgi:hypothetical protein
MITTEQVIHIMNEAGRPTLTIGLTDEDLIRLQNKEIITFDTFPNHGNCFVLLFNGQTNEDMQEIMKAHPEVTYKIV